MTLTITDPLAPMSRTDAAAATATAPDGDTGGSAGFALVLADMLDGLAVEGSPAADAAGALPVTTPAPVSAPVAGGTVLDGLGRVAVPVAADPAALPVPLPPGVPVAVAAPAAIADQASAVEPPPAAAEAEIATASPVGDAADMSGLSGAADEGQEAAEEPAPAVALSQPATPEETAPRGDSAAQDADRPDPSSPDPATAGRDAEEMPPVALTMAPVAALAAAPATTGGDAPPAPASDPIRVGAALPPLPSRAAKAAQPEAAPQDTAQGAEADTPAFDEAAGKPAEKRVPADRPALPADPVAQLAGQGRAMAEPAPPVRADSVAGADGAAVPQSAPASAPQLAPASAPQPVGAAPVQTDRPGWEAALADRIAAELSADGQQIELELRPDRLGALKITLEIVDGQAQVRFVTETPDAARLIQQNEHRLSESLSRAGLGLGGHESTSRDAQQQGQGDRSGRNAPRGAEIAFQRSAEPRPGVPSGRGGSGLVNLIA